MAHDDILRVGDWVRFPDTGSSDPLSKRAGKVLEVYESSGRIRVNVSGEIVYVSTHLLTKITMPEDDAGPFCGCGEPVNRKGQACQWCLREDIEYELETAF